MDTVAKPIPGFEEFSGQVNSIFAAPGDDGNDVEFQLVETNDLFSDERFHSFSLLFRAPLTTRSEQGIFTLKNATLGTLDLFLVPVKQTDEGLFFEASFNLMK
ncbi:MAG: hypothetical protein ABL999_09130 [Pyrinomonadaceae bacterium]